MFAIEARSLRRVFIAGAGIWKRRSKEIEAVAGIALAVPPGALFGLLGPNGAGKTTTVKMLTTLHAPSSGQALVMGFDAVRQERQVQRRIGFIFGGERGLYGRLSALDNLRYFVLIRNSSGAWARSSM